MNVPVVSVVMITYGHAAYIGRAIEGVLMQECDFDFELIIANDNSPDDTDRIVKSIIDEHPKGHCIKYFMNNPNKGMMPNFIFALGHARGKYIALCEGDDYWTDALKLQKQVSLLESDSGYSMCCGGYISKHTITGEEKTVILNKAGNAKDSKGFDFTLSDMQNQWITKSLTSMYVKDKFNPEIFNKYNHSRDIHLFYHLATEGKGYYFREVFGCYNIHPGGVNSMQQGKANFNAAYNSYKELHMHNKTAFTRKMALSHVLALFNYDLYNSYETNTFKRKLQLIKEAFSLIKNKAEIKMFFSAFINRKFKDKLKKQPGKK